MNRWSTVAASISTRAVCVALASWAALASCVALASWAALASCVALASCLALTSCSTAALPAPVQTPVLSVNKPTGTVALWGTCGPTSYSTNLEPLFQVMQQRGLTQYRVQINLTADTDSYEVTMLQSMVSLGAKYGVVMKPILFTAFAFGDATDNGLYPLGNNAALYSQGYTRTLNFVRLFPMVRDWEMGNEINLLARDANGNKLYGDGWTAAEFNQPIMVQWASVLQGMSDAIAFVNIQSNLTLRRTLNTTSTMFGFLDFMLSRGVAFDIVSYHYYENLGTNPHNYYGGVRPNFDLFVELASYQRPVVFNEVNAGEIYKAGYENLAGQPLTEEGFSSLNATLTYLNTQTSADIEAVDVYELLDDPSKAVPEDHFGLMYNINTPKVPLYQEAGFAGVPLSAAETQQLTSRGFTY